MDKLYDLKDDVVFKETFTQNTKESYEARRSFLSAILQKELRSCDLMLNEPHYGLLDQKELRMDFSAVFDDGEMANIEMQCFQTKDDLKKRFTYYLCGMLISQELKGKDYSSLKPCYVIVILNFSLFKEDNELFHFFQLKDKGVAVGNLINLISIELTKLNEKTDFSMYSEIEAWSYFLKYGATQEKQYIIKLITTKYGGIKMAEESRNGISASRIEFLQKLRNDMYNRQDYYDEIERKYKELIQNIDDMDKKYQETLMILEQKYNKSQQEMKSMEEKYNESQQEMKSMEEKYIETLSKKEDIIKKLEKELTEKK